MTKKYKVIISTLVIIGLLVIAGRYLAHTNIPVLEPKGTIAYKERQLIFITLAMSLIVIVPVFAMLFGFAWRYREGNKKAKYSPEFDHNRIAETIWWLVPAVLIFVLGIIIWKSSYGLDPYKPLSSVNKPITIQVVALDWKWLFIYPDENIATVNYFQIPNNTPVNFQITADAPMNSFWLPQLGGQIYAMPGMSTELHLMATSQGIYNGSSANISGRGFASMTFVARSSSAQSYRAWIKQVKQAPKALTQNSYAALAAPSTGGVVYYKQAETGLYDTIMMKYMLPTGETTPGGDQALSNIMAGTQTQ